MVEYGLPKAETRVRFPSPAPLTGNNNHEEAIFEEALTKNSDAERTAFLEGACRNDPRLRARLAALLEGHLEAQGFLDTAPESDPADGTAVLGEMPVFEQPGEKISRYKLLEKIGEGGCSVLAVRQLLGHESEVLALDLSADGETIVSGAGDGHVLKWSLAETAGGGLNLAEAKRCAVLEDGRILIHRPSAQGLEYYDPVKGRVEPARTQRFVPASTKMDVDLLEVSPNAKWAVSAKTSPPARTTISSGESLPLGRRACSAISSSTTRAGEGTLSAGRSCFRSGS